MRREESKFLVRLVTADIRRSVAIRTRRRPAPIHHEGSTTNEAPKLRVKERGICSPFPHRLAGDFDER